MTRHDGKKPSGLSRRSFLGLSVTLPAVSMVAPLGMSRALAANEGFRHMGSQNFARRPFNENLFMAFNPIANPEAGESDEFTTIGNLERILRELDVPEGTTVIGIGARSGTASDPYGKPGEMGYVWRVGEPWNGKVTSPVDASPVEFFKDDPITVTQVGILNDETAHRLTFADPERAGSVLWSLENDETAWPVVNRGFHNMFSARDNGMTETLFRAAQVAKRRGRNWATPRWRRKLEAFIPDLADDQRWANFVATFPKGLLHTVCLAYIKEQGWQGAAVVLRGNMANVAQFHLLEWNQTSPSESRFKLWQGEHFGPFQIELGREVRPFMTRDEASWTMAGFLWDVDYQGAQPNMSEWQKAADLFGNDFHIHGFRDDGLAGGHTLFSMLGEGPLEVALYPLKFQEGETAFCFNNDLMLIRESLTATDRGVSIKVRNNGELYARNVALTLSGPGRGEEVTRIVQLLEPRQEVWVNLASSSLVSGQRGVYQISLDPRGRFLEGGDGTANNVIRFDEALRIV